MLVAVSNVHTQKGFVVGQRSISIQPNCAPQRKALGLGVAQHEMGCNNPVGIRMASGRTKTEANVASSPAKSEVLKDNQFRIDAVPGGSGLLVGDAAVFNVAGSFCATQAKCTHRGGPLNEGTLNGSTVTCPWHGSQFNVCTGAVLRGPATEPVKTYRVIVEGEIGRMEREN
jgi:nitrite reductase/ring-hydroxylating ferredoxin subunit